MSLKSLFILLYKKKHTRRHEALEIESRPIEA